MGTANLTDVLNGEDRETIEAIIDEETGDIRINLAQKANINGDNTKKFKVANAETDDEAISKSQAETLISNIDLSGKADKSNVLTLDNTDEFTPEEDYEPATKKYVDDKPSADTKLSTDGKSIIKNDNSNIKNQCTAWVNFDGTTAPPTIRDSFNVSDVVRTDTGDYDVYFEEDMDNRSYTAVGNAAKGNETNNGNYILQCGGANNTYTTDKTVSKIAVKGRMASNTEVVDSAECQVQIFGGKN